MTQADASVVERGHADQRHALADDRWGILAGGLLALTVPGVRPCPREFA
ncbi:hypothetical protein ACGF13_37895 [Kitasatospora sp. NPDC048286]